jgi:two-component system, OmpR family, response regulator CpxR
MRPRKRILLIDHDEHRLGVLRFVLKQHQYAVLSAATPQEAEEFERIDLVIAAWPCNATTVGDLAHRHFVPSIVLGYGVTGAMFDLSIDIFMPNQFCNPTDILERVRFGVARKRGPRLGSKRNVATVSPATANNAVA